MTSTNMFIVALVLQLLDIHWIIMGSQFILFCASLATIVYHRYSTIFIDFLVVSCGTFCIYFFSSYQRLKVNKMSFLKTKKTRSML